MAGVKCVLLRDLLVSSPGTKNITTSTRLAATTSTSNWFILSLMNILKVDAISLISSSRVKYRQKPTLR